MCSNYEPVTKDQSNWVKNQLSCELPQSEWKAHVYKYYKAPFIYVEEGITKCELGHFGLLPSWVPAKNRSKYAQSTYNARIETVEIRDSYKSPWRNRKFGLVLANRFYEPLYDESGTRSKPTAIFRTDGEPTAIAAIWESFFDEKTSEVIRSFSMLTMNATSHPLMNKFHKPNDEKRSVVVINNRNMTTWLNASHAQAIELIMLSPDDYLNADLLKPVSSQISIFD